MGLDTSHDCWHGAYSAFNRWRTMLARVAGMPPLVLMEGFFDPEQAVTGNPFWKQYEEDKQRGCIGEGSIWSQLPIRWEGLNPSPLHTLLHHSDCDGEIAWQECDAIADALEALIPLLPKVEAAGHIGDWRDKTQTFVDGLRVAAKKQENVEFH